MEKNFNGWLNVFKERGQTSFAVSNAIKKNFKFKKVGHLGTLDPLATGVLPIAVGEATKVISFISNIKKRYSFIIKWGEERDTCYLEGEVTEIQPSPGMLLMWPSFLMHGSGNTINKSKERIILGFNTYWDKK